MSGFNHYPTDEYKALVQAIQAMAEEDGWDMANRAYAESVAETWRERYLKEHNLEDAIFVEQEDYVRPPEWTLKIDLSHKEVYRTKDRKHFLVVGHCYQVEMRWFMHIQRLCAEHGLAWRISAGSWHFPGAAVLVEIAEDLKDRNFLAWQGSLAKEGGQA